MQRELSMRELSLYPTELAEMSVGQLASLSPLQLQEANTHLDDLIAWAKKTRTKLDTALDQRFGEQAKSALRESGRDFGTAHVTDGVLRVTLDLPKRVSWDQKQLGAIAERIVAAGERVSDYMDVDLSVPESRFNNWPAVLREQFALARTVKAGKAAFRLTLADAEVQS
jgi:hypothetical protein